MQIRYFNNIFAVLVVATIAMLDVSKTQAQDDSSVNIIPGVTKQELSNSLPETQQIFRVESVKAVDSQISEGAKISMATYADQPPEGWQKVHIPRKLGLIGKVQTTIYIMRVIPDEKRVDLAIRGTDNFDDVLIDLNTSAQMDEVLQIPLHSGFRSVARDVYKSLQNELKGRNLDAYSFRLFGHSLGGAVAAIVSMYLHQAGRNVEMVATFGAPRFTTNEGARKYQVLNMRTFRVVRCDDVVPFLPPPNFFGWSNGSYEANGNIILLLTPPYFDYSVGLDIERDFVFQLRNELSNTLSRSEFAFGHRMKNYNELLFWFTGEGINRNYNTKITNGSSQIIPVSYNSALKSKLCPSKLLGPGDA